MEIVLDILGNRRFRVGIVPEPPNGIVTVDFEIPAETPFRLQEVFGGSWRHLGIGEFLIKVYEGHRYSVTREMRPAQSPGSTQASNSAPEVPRGLSEPIVLPSGHSAKVEGEDWSDSERAAQMLHAGDYHAVIGRNDPSPQEWYRGSVETYPTVLGWCRLARTLRGSETVVVGTEKLNALMCLKKALAFPIDTLQAIDCVALVEYSAAFPNLIHRSAACDLYTRAVVLDPALSAAWNGLGVTIANDMEVEVDGRRYRGADCCWRAVELDSTFATAWYNLGRLLQIGSTLTNAPNERIEPVKCFIRALEEDDSCSEAWQELLHLLGSTGETVTIASVSHDSMSCRERLGNIEKKLK